MPIFDNDLRWAWERQFSMYVFSVGSIFTRFCWWWLLLVVNSKRMFSLPFVCYVDCLYELLFFLSVVDSYFPSFVRIKFSSLKIFKLIQHQREVDMGCHGMFVIYFERNCHHFFSWVHFEMQYNIQLSKEFVINLASLDHNFMKCTRWTFLTEQIVW